MKALLRLVICVGCVLVLGCSQDMPDAPDGSGALTIMVVDSTGLFPGSVPGVPFCLDSAEVRVKSRSHEFSALGYTNIDGVVEFEDLVSGLYDVFARKEAMIENNEKLFTGGFDFQLSGFESKDYTVTVNLIAASDLMINEVFYCGSDYSSFYFYDQFVELYNAADTTMYLDGIILTRQVQSAFPEQDEVPYIRAIYAYQFPGTPVTGRQYPIEPGQFVVIAADAIDHTAWNDKSIDLSGADWECFNALGGDYDVPGVPNLINIVPTVSVDYMINLSHNGVVIATGESYSFMERDTGTGLYILIPIETVIDGIEYASRSTSTKELTSRVDAGFAGLGCTKYSGQSTERRELGLDTNDSSFDFTLIDRPTPGWSHVNQ